MGGTSPHLRHEPPQSRAALKNKSRDAKPRLDPENENNLRLYCPSTHAKINGATIVASLSTMYFGVLA